MKSPITLSLILLSAGLATVAAQAEGGPGRSLLAADGSTRRIALVGPDGSLKWEYAIRDIHDLHRLPNGNILFQTSFQRLTEVNPLTNQVVWEYDAAQSNGNKGRPVEVHAFQRLRNGNTMIAESGPARIIEVDREGRLVHQIALKVDHPSTHSDTRQVRQLENGHYLVAQEHDAAIREYDHEGKLVWDYPVPLFGKEPKGGHGPEAFGNQAFAALRLRNGNTLVTTGNGHSVLEVTPDKKIVWELHQNDLPGITLAWVTTLQQRPNGNIIFGNCHAGPENPQIVEVTREKKVVWSYKDFKNFGNALSNSLVLEDDGK